MTLTRFDFTLPIPLSLFPFLLFVHCPFHSSAYSLPLQFQKRVRSEDNEGRLSDETKALLWQWTEAQRDGSNMGNDVGETFPFARTGETRISPSGSAVRFSDLASEASAATLHFTSTAGIASQERDSTETSAPLYQPSNRMDSIMAGYVLPQPVTTEDLPPPSSDGNLLKMEIVIADLYKDLLKKNACFSFEPFSQFPKIN